MSRTKRPEIVTTPPLMVARECAAAALGISEGTLEALVRRGELPKPRKISAARVGWLWRELQEFAEGLRALERLADPGRDAAVAEGLRDCDRLRIEVDVDVAAALHLRGTTG